MAWPAVPTKIQVPTSLGWIELRVRMTVSDAGDISYESVVWVLDQNDELMETVVADLDDVLNQGQKTQLKLIVSALWSDAMEELLSS